MKRIVLGLVILIASISTANAWWVPGHYGPAGGWIGGHYRYGGWIAPHVNYTWYGMPYYVPGHPTGYPYGYYGYGYYRPYYCHHCY